jgi:hypothetical protein
MPTILTLEGYRFFIPTLDHGPAHIHVAKAEATAQFYLSPLISLKQVNHMKNSDLARAFEIALDHQEIFLQAWTNIHPDKPLQ